MTRSIGEAFRGDFKVGAALNNQLIRMYPELIAEQFTSATCENQMKFALIHPSPDAYHFEPADEIAAFCKKSAIPMRGHTLVWHSQAPDWLFLKQDGEFASRDTVLGRLKDHMQTVMDRYKDQIYCWDVVNEAVYDTAAHNQFSPDSLVRASRWTQTVGEDYVEQAFRLAESLNPGAQLFYNDYNEWFPDKRDRIIRLVKGLQNKGIQIDGLGLQGHWSLYSPTPAELRESIELYGELGLRLHVTELDVSCYRDREEDEYPGFSEELEERQAEYYAQVFTIFREYKDLFDAITFWGVSDDGSWLNNFPKRGRKNWPLLFGYDHQPKKAFDRILQL